MDLLPEPTTLPHLNAGLNGAAALTLIAGYVFIRRRRVSAHRACMVAALGLSALFLASYLVYHFQVGSVRYEGEGWLRPFYFGILITHTVLATAILPLIGLTVWRTWRRQFERHRTLARWTLPLWMYVSVTGVAVYVMLYRLG
jgi:uncharacterized membrane protein YozB (DUF420 family)